MAPLRAVPLLKSREEQDAVVLVCLLICVCSGMVNAGVFYEVGELVTNMTGTVMHVGRLSVSQLAPNAPRLMMLWTLLGSYVSGSLLAGICMGHERWRNLMVATALLYITSFLLMGAAAALSEGHFAGAYLACMSSGLHNGLSTRVTGFVRTSHSTGTLTDIGLVLGEALVNRESRKDWMVWRRFAILVSLLASYIVGAALMTSMCEELGTRSLWLPAGILCLLATGGALYILHEYLLIKEYLSEHQEGLGNKGESPLESGAQREPSASPPARPEGSAWEELQEREIDHVEHALELAEGMPSVALGTLETEESMATHIHLHHVDSTIIGHSALAGEAEEHPSLAEKRESMRRNASLSDGTPYLAI